MLTRLMTVAFIVAAGVACRPSDPTPPPIADCTPACRAGYTCANGACVSACNPACESGDDCVGAGSSAKCVPRERACVPACIAGHVCSNGGCVSACNPPCGKFEECDPAAPEGPACVSEATMLERRLEAELEAEKERDAVEAIRGALKYAEPPPGAKRFDPNEPVDTTPPQPPPLPPGHEALRREAEEAFRRAVVSEIPPAAPAPPTRSRADIEAEIRSIDAQLRVGDYLEGSSQAEELKERQRQLRSQLPP